MATADARIEWAGEKGFTASIHELGSLLIQSMNEVIDVHGRCKTMNLWARIPSTIWAALYIVAVLTMATVGYQAGVPSNN